MTDLEQVAASHGFTAVKSEPVSEVEGTVHLMHHTASGANESADKANHRAAQKGLDDLCSLAFIFQGAFFRHDRTYDKFDAQKQRHEDGEVSHSGARQHYSFPPG